MTISYLKIERGDDGSSVYDSMPGTTTMLDCPPRKAVMDILSKNPEWKVISIYETQHNKQSAKELIIWVER